MKYRTIPELLDLAGKVTIVTGGAKGIGLGIARRLHEAGTQVVIADMDEDEGQKVVEKLISIRSESAVFCKTDVSKKADVDHLIKTCVQAFGRLDIMINNAGIFPFHTLHDMTEEQFMQVTDINLRGVFLGCKVASSQMIKQGNGGTIITITSIDALHPSSVGLAAYDASKHGAWGFLKNIALELAPHNIRVNAVAPGGVDTPGARQMAGGTIDESLTVNVPMKRFADPDEIGRVTLFLASDMASYMTGSQVVVDGGTLLT